MFNAQLQYQRPKLGLILTAWFAILGLVHNDVSSCEMHPGAPFSTICHGASNAWNSFVRVFACIKIGMV